MIKKQAIIDDFYLKTFLIGWGISCVVWSFMIFQFWWGNHDWGYLRSGISLTSGFFEARYSLQLPTILFLDGHIYPVLTIISTLALLVCLGILVGVYLDVPKKLKNYLFLVFFAGFNPYNFALFYYNHYMFSLVFWGCVGIVFLFFNEKTKIGWGTVFNVLLIFLLLGSYPPIIMLILVLFMAKRLKRYCDGQETLVQICKLGIYFSFQFLLGYLGFKLVFLYLDSRQFINNKMYNLSFRSMRDVLYQIIPELMQSLLQLFHQYTFLENAYCLLTAILVIFAVILVYQSKVSKFGITLLVLGLFLVSRFAFLLAGDSSKIAEFRLEYWGKQGVMFFALSVILRNKSLVVKNFSNLWLFILFFFFACTSFEIQKVQHLGFLAGRKMQQRMHEYVTRQPMFDFKKQYLSITLGNPNFRIRYVDDKYFTSEMTGNTLTFPVEYIFGLFWDDTLPFITVRSSLGKNVIYRSSNVAIDYWRNNPQNMENIRYWLYNDARYSNVYVDDRYIIAVLDMNDFYKYRELVAAKLDK